MKLVFDIETDGLYHDLTCIHCIAVTDLDSDESYIFNDVGTEQPITKGIQLLEDAEYVIGHNIIRYDIPVIRKLYPWFTCKAQAIDTLVLSRCYHPDMLALDHKRKWPQMPLQLYGRHSLESYGYRLKEYKGQFGKTTDWKEWSQDMQDYMVQDVKVTKKLWKHFVPYLSGSR